MKRKVDTGALSETVVVAASTPPTLPAPSPPAAEVPWALPSCLVYAPPAIDDTSFDSEGAFFIDTSPAMASPIHETSFPVPSPRAILGDICDDNAVTSITSDDEVLFTYRDVVTR
jgi:hypothetical protein